MLTITVFFAHELLLSMSNSRSWSKVRLKQPSQQDLEGPEGLVPAAYIERVRSDSSLHPSGAVLRLACATAVVCRSVRLHGRI